MSLPLPSNAPEADAGSLSTTYTVVGLSVPNGALLGVLDVQITSRGSATKATYYLCADSDGDHALSPASEVDIVSGATDSTDGGASVGLNRMLWIAPSWGTAGTMYVALKVDAGTPSARVRCTWQRADP